MKGGSLVRGVLVRTTLSLLALVGTFDTASGQGLVNFNNRVVGVVDARVTFCPFEETGAGWSAQLFGGPQGTPLSQLTALFPTTTFRTSSAGAFGYVNPVTVTVPGVLPGQRATLVMRVFPPGESSATPIYFDGNVITVPLGGDILPPTNLVGMQAFFTGPLGCPEPSTLILGGIASLVLLCSRRSHRTAAPEVRR